ncbi:glycogen/starch/alpha-glucan phosphorylase [Desemzia sp. FAM 23989]|uniref:glycogen/starch/alpha-glucan phosphorylase n=1 Tax=Desemzia sp. FAM 23989 TaxID=3259523 RepID=UPI00388500E3
MTLQVAEFKKDYERLLKGLYGLDVKEASPIQLYSALGTFVKAYAGENWTQTKIEYEKKQVKQLYYFSMEFLPGRMLKSNLLNLGILDTIRNGIEEIGLDFQSIVEAEEDPALGNGGLGRLASCFMDSIASLGIPGAGSGIRYKYGLFQQRFIDGHQVEVPDNWLRNGNVWEVRKENKTINVRFGGQVYLTEEEGRFVPIYDNTRNILAVPYDTAMIGYQNNLVNNMRLWSAEIPPEDYVHYSSITAQQEVNQLTEVLYPDDSNYEGRILRLRQEYFLCSAGVQSIVRYYKKLHLPMIHIADRVAIHINDTHPALCIPEFIRIMIDEEGLSWEQAWEIGKKVMSYTNHTIMQEAMEKWPIEMLQAEIPRVYQVIEEINRRHIEKKLPIYGEELTYQTAIIKDGVVNMAHLAIIGSHSVNGVAQLHTNILKNDVLKHFFEMYPIKFNNKTNGITQRRWLQIANEDLTKFIDDRIGTEWKKKPSELKILKGYANNVASLRELAEVKLRNKQRFAQHVESKMGLIIDPNALFDVQIKRLHAYKRQLLNVLHILSRYLDIKENPELDIQPRVFIFGAKAAPSYLYAKQIIKVINAVAELVNNDPDIGNKLKVVFVENYGVTLAELIIPAAEVSEQISLASKEASGTSNMKLMLNGALTVATLDGANVEIRDYVGEDNIFLFGLTSDEVYDYYENGTYSSRTIYDSSPKLRKVLNTLIDGTIPDIKEEGRVIFDSLVKYNDEYFVLKDFEEYITVQHQVDELYQDKQLWNQKSLLNIANSGPFSADFTIMRYAEEIWKIDSEMPQNEQTIHLNEPI